MKNIAFAALAAVPCIVAVAPAATLEEYTAIVDEQLSSIKEIVNVLASAKDKASADAAAEKLVVVLKKSQETEAKADALGEPTPEIAAELEKMLEARQEELSAAFSALLPVAIQLNKNNFYGSTDLKAVLEAIWGAEEEDVEDDMEDAE